MGSDGQECPSYSMMVSDPPMQMEMQLIADKLDELITALQRF